MRSIHLGLSAAILSFFVATAFAAGQTATPSQNTAADATPQTTAPNIRANTNLVLLDVVVTDRGQAVHGIDRGRFHIFEDGKEQTITSFEEHQPAPVSLADIKPVVLPPHTYTNAPLYPQASAFNVLLLDGLNTPVDKQTDVRKQMVEYMGKIAPGTSFAVFTLSSRLRMIAGFTTDASQIAKAMESAMATSRPSDVTDSGLSVDNASPPVNFAGLGGSGSDWGSMLQQWESDTAAVQTDERVKITLDAFRQLALYLSGIPGRKNVIWFSGSFPIGLGPDASARNDFDIERMYTVEVRETSEAMRAARVAVYPVDGRGLMNFSTVDASYGSMATTGNSMGRRGGVTLAVANDMHQAMETRAQEDSSMDLIAKETGGKAYLNANDLSIAVADAIQNGSSYYTITYVPENKNFNGAFRKLRVHVEGSGLTVANPDGYFADPAEKLEAKSGLQVGSFLASTLHGAPPSTQILFNTRVLPATDPHFSATKFSTTPAGADAAQLKGSLHRTVVDLLVDPRGLDFATTADGTREDLVEFVLVAYDGDGKRVNYVDQKAPLGLDAEHYARVRASGFPVRMELDLPAGNFSLRIAVFDLNSGHMGSLEVPLTDAAK